MNKETNTKKNILEQIEKGEILMKPKIHFTLKTFAVAFALIIGALITLFLFSFVIFTMKGSGVLHLVDFGGKGYMLLLLTIPWLLVVFILALILALEALAKYFAFVYRKPVVYSVLAILLIVVFAGSAIAATPLHKKMHNRAFNSDIPFGGGKFYMKYGKTTFEGGFAGKIESIDSNGLTITTALGKSIFVSTSTDTKYPQFRELAVGEHVVVAGEQFDDRYVADWIKPLRERKIPLIRDEGGPKNLRFNQNFE